MDVIKDLGTRRNSAGKSYRYGLFKCPYCNLSCERPYFNGIKAKSCGCHQYEKKYEKGRKYLRLKCTICNSEYEQQERLFNKSKWKYRCKAHRKHLVLINNKYVSPTSPRSRDGGPTEHCSKCGKLIWRGSTTCKSCAQLGISKSGKPIPKKYCVSCGKLLSRQAEKYCLKCWNKAQDRGLSRERTKFTLSKAWVNVRSKCFRRDDYTCQKCGAKNKKGLNRTVALNAHHIIPYRNASNLRYEISNLVTLCEQCHNNVHKNDRGEDRANTKLSQRVVQAIKRLVERGTKQQQIAVKYNVSQSTVSHIACGRTWSHVQPRTIKRKGA